MSIGSSDQTFYTYWLVPVNLTGIPGPKSDPRGMIYQDGNNQRFQFIPRWNANYVRPLAGHPAQVPPDTLFGAVQGVFTDRAGTPQTLITVTGEVPLQAMYPVHPQIFHAQYGHGGQLLGGVQYWFMLALYTANGLSQVSVPFAAFIPDTTVTDLQITFDGLVYPPDPAPNDQWVGYRLYCHDTLEKICQVADVSYTAGSPPPTITFGGPRAYGTSGIPADVGTKVSTAVKARICWHSGVAGVAVSDVQPNVIISGELGPHDNWTGRDCSILGPATMDEPAFGLLDFHITGSTRITWPPNSVYTATQLTVTPDPLSAGVQPNMAMVMRTKPDIIGADYIGDSMMVNDDSIAYNPPNGGMVPSVEIGRFVYLFRGKGAGQLRQVVDGPQTSNTTLQVDSPWTVMPDSSTWFLVLDAAFTTDAPVSTTFVSKQPHPKRPQRSGVSTQMTQTVQIDVSNIQFLMVFVEAYLVLDGQETPEVMTEQREVYIVGQNPGVRVIGPSDNDPATPGVWWTLTVDDMTVIVDTSQNDVHLQLPPLNDYQGRSCLIYNAGDPASGFTAYVETSQPDTFSDGTTEFALSPGNSLSITAAGIFPVTPGASRYFRREP
jgi:hypothetical protein